ncbi:MAG: glutamine--fructose-6-phosphate aminotransferase [Deltaproteobacteria bacterium RIFCSPLOWO2_12_FULL_50_11]|nr:MAG: glutamine--fructose-6-phosphate aminotransferase [Deltaproteobacteria bacterium RIFCSPLOWO2_12_FULL_50_11]
MCGIIGCVGGQEASEILIEGLRRLEYRGYDSAGVAIIDNGIVQIQKVKGKIADLQKILNKLRLKGTIGIGHTRWATHGRPSELNAHPHHSKDITVVHNGIIENYRVLVPILKKKGYVCKSETDSEIICHLIQMYLDQGLKMEKAFPKALCQVRGSYALAVLYEKEPHRIYVAKNASPLVVGKGQGENFVASDIPAILNQTRTILILEDQEWGFLEKDTIRIFNLKGQPIRRSLKTIQWSLATTEKDGFRHFMLKEIYEQPMAVQNTLSGRLGNGHQRIDLPELEPLFPRKKNPFERIYIVACGTSYHAGMVGKYMMESMARIPVIVDLASEFRYRQPVLDSRCLMVVISQSGETADTLAVVQMARQKKAKIVSICNVMDSSIPRISEATLYTHAGPEIGVASTKAFTAQLVVLSLFSLFLGDLTKNLNRKDVISAIESLSKIPSQMKKILRPDAVYQRIARKYAHCPSLLYFARGINAPIALEGALKLKEISYIHAEGYAAGELKHGPIALIDEGVPVVVLIPQDEHYDKTYSNIEEVQTRGADLIALATQGDKLIPKIAKETIFIPKTQWFLSPLLFSIPIQLMAYYMADYKGTDVDQPRNLAKSVTVE